MKLIALISWYDEPADSLARIVADAGRCGVTHLLALDGAYATYPGGAGHSPDGQADALLAACEQADIVGLVSQPDVVWSNGEVEKRSALFAQAAIAFEATLDDWFLVLDADETIDHAQDLKPLLATSKADVWDTLVIEDDASTYGDIRTRWNRRAFRCVPGLHVHPRSHWHYLDGAGRILWGYNAIPAAGHLPILLRNHSTGSRDQDRSQAREQYYAQRNALQLENYDPETCSDCDEPWVGRVNIIDLEELPTGKLELTMKRTMFCCAAHLKRYQDWNTWRINQRAAQLPPHQAAQVIASLTAAKAAKDERTYAERLASIQ